MKRRKRKFLQPVRYDQLLKYFIEIEILNVVIFFSRPKKKETFPPSTADFFVLFAKFVSAGR